MKTLSQHIEEKLIINKDFKKCIDNKPNVNGGLFLRLFINTWSNKINSRIDIELENYKFRNRFKDNDGYYKKK